MRKLPAMKALAHKNAHGATVPATETAADVSGLVRKGVVAGAAQVSPRCIDNWMKRRLIPFVRIGARCVRFHLPSVLAALRKMEVREVTRE